MDQDCINLTSYLTEREAGSRFAGDALADLCGAGELSAGIVMRATDGLGRRQHLRADQSLRSRQGLPALAVAVSSRLNVEALLDQALKLSGRGLVTLGRTRLLSEDIDPVRVWDKPGEETKLTVYFSRRDRVYQVPAFEVICELLYRRGISGATVVAGLDGTFSGQRLRRQFAGRDDSGPMMVSAVGSGQRLGLILPELGDLLRHPLITVEQVRICKRDGQLISPPDAVPGADADGRPWRGKLSVYACDSVRHDGQSVHQSIRRRLHSAGIGNVITLPGVWGFHGDYAPRGGRHVPGVTIVTDIPERMPTAFSIIDELTAKRGLVTSETVAAVGAGNTDA